MLKLCEEFLDLLVIQVSFQINFSWFSLHVSFLKVSTTGYCHISKTNIDIEGFKFFTDFPPGFTFPEEMQCETIIVAYSGNVIRKTNCILHPNVLEIGTTSLKQLYCKYCPI